MTTTIDISKRLEGKEDVPTSIDDTGSRIIRKLPKIRVKGIIKEAK